MRRNHFEIVYSFFLILLFMFIPLISIAQGPPDPNDVPVDGGIGFLLAAGAGYGIKKLKNMRKSTKKIFN